MTYRVERRKGRLWLKPASSGLPLHQALLLACDLAGWGRPVQPPAAPEPEAGV